MRKIFLKILVLILFFPIFPILAQKEQLTLTITPPLIKVNLSPGQSWQSSLKIVNNNPQDLDLFVSTKDFKSGKEGGIIFIEKKEEEDERFLLSQWIKVPEGPISIPAFQSRQIPFSISVPPNAEPGGKYAAILVGTKPPEEKGTVIKITPLVSSLILATVRGEVKEEIWIREFSTNKTFYQKPNVQFTLKIENIGNVHIHPQGEIKILNMFGKERGVILFNQKTEYGNILPQSSRKWTFNWEKEKSLFETGRYKAVLTLIYGNEGKQTTTREIYFWIVPWGPILAILGSLLAIFGFLFLLVRIYVKRTITATITLIKKEIPVEREKKRIPVVGEFSTKILDIKKASPAGKTEVLKEGFPKEKTPKTKNIFLERKFLLPTLFVLLIIIFVVFLFSREGMKEDKNYQVSTKEEGGILSLPIVEEVKKEPTKEEEIEVEKKSFKIVVLNGSGIKGLASEVAKNLEKEGFQIEKVGNAEHFNYQQSLINYKKEKEREAKFLNQFFKEKFKLMEKKDQEEDIILIIGHDFK